MTGQANKDFFTFHNCFHPASPILLDFKETGKIRGAFKVGGLCVFITSGHIRLDNALCKRSNGAMGLAVHFFSSFSPNKINFQAKVMAYRYYFSSPGCKHVRQSRTSSNTSSPRPEEGSLVLGGSLLSSHAPGSITKKCLALFSSRGQNAFQKKKKRVSKKKSRDHG